MAADDVKSRARAALESVTPGPWEVRDGFVYPLSISTRLGGIRPTDAEFIAAARTLVPELLDEVERLHAYLTSLGDDEKGHIVRFSDGHFNAQHPLHERVGNQLLDCDIHREVERWYADGGSTDDSTWRVVHRDQVDGEEASEWPWMWEQVG